MHLKEIARSLSFHRSSSLSTRNVDSSILTDSISSQSMRFTKYENLSQSMRLEDGYVIETEAASSQDFTGKVQRSATFSSWGRSKLKSVSVFSGRFNGGKFRNDVSADDEFADKHKKKPTKSESHEIKEPKLKVKVKKRISWLPDPSHRWPIQGW